MLIRLILLWVSCVGTASALPPVDINSNQQKYSLQDSLEVLNDISDQFSSEDILSGAYDANFEQAPELIPPIYLFEEAYWFRFSLRNISQQAQALTLQVLPQTAGEAILFVPDAMQQNYQSVVSGVFYPAEERVQPVFHTAFEITLAPSQTSTYYLKVRPFQNQNISFELVRTPNFINQIAGEHIIYGLFFGAMLIMVFYNFFIFIATRDLAYFYYVLYVSSLCLTLFHAEWLASAYLWTDSREPFTIWMLSFLFTTSMGLAVLFIRALLHLSIHLPRWDRFFSTVMLIGIGLCFIFLFLPPQFSSMPENHLAFNAALILSLIGIVLFFITGVLALRAGVSAAKYYLSAWSLFLLGVLLNGLRLLDVLPTNLFTHQMVFIGALCEVTFLSFALADRINAMRRERDKAQKELLTTQRALNEELQQRVDEKTAELTNSHQKILTLERQKATDIERQRIMLDLHDGMGGHLVSALSYTEAKLGRDNNLHEILSLAMQDLRIMIDSMDCEEDGLITVLAMLRQRLEPVVESRNMELIWQVNDEPIMENFGPSQSVQVTRIVQEAITNILKHAQATQINLTLDKNSICIQDNGCAPESSGNGGYGLSSMKNRAGKVNASLDFDFGPKGSCVTLYWS
ncbi:MAG: 7TM diverse intracellular signaling domain-containing protein [Pseudomonadota bacterium]